MNDPIAYLERARAQLEARELDRSLADLERIHAVVDDLMASYDVPPKDAERKVA